MTPYVVYDSDSEGTKNNGPQKPKSIMVTTSNGDVNGTANGSVKRQLNGSVNGGSTVVHVEGEDAAESPDSLPSRSSVSARSIIGNGKNGKSGALKRVSFGSSKGSMVETLVYDHQEDLLHSEVPAYLTASPVSNGEESRVHPAKVRVKFIESQQVAQVSCATPSPDVTLDFFSDTMTSPASEFSTEYRRQISHESGIDNPFRPDGELSREAEAIVSLIKEGKPITPCELDMDMANGGFPQSQHDATDSTTNGKVVKEVAVTSTQSKPKPTNGSTVTQPGVVEVQRGVIVPPMDAPAVEQVVIKKKPKCNCCVIQ